MLHAGHRVLASDAQPWGQVAGVPCLNIDGIEVEILVAFIVLAVEDSFRVPSPFIRLNRPQLCSDATIIALAKRAHPDLQSIMFIRREVGSTCAVGREERLRSPGVAEQYLARD